MPQNSSNSSANRPAENLHPYGGVDHVHEAKQDDHEIKHAAEGFGTEARTEVLGLDESAETNDQISEVLSKRKDQSSGGGKAYASASKKEIEALRASLLKNLPSERVMKKQVEAEIRKEIKYLRSRAMSLIKSPYSSMSFFEMSNLVRKIRELRGILYSLVKMSLERLKTLWLRFVHGIM
ncbi:MAG: hypothetical protein WC285_00615 [Candidatus Gracilibacteria bacterium]|jgi:hypothetical protein